MTKLYPGRMIMIGKRFSHFKIVSKLGAGGMGVVFKATDTKLERDVAIKFLPKEVAADVEVKERFKIEAKAAAALNHPNIATIHQIEELDGELFIVMEYLEGKELCNLIKESDGLSVEDAINYVIQIAQGLQAAHDKGIIHRDIKSSNIMITKNDVIKIMDFGLAKIGTGVHLTKENTTLGTIAYMSPEQCIGNEVDHRSDIWSFGIVFYELLTGDLPFDNVYEQAIIYSILNEEPKPISSLRNDIPDWLESIVSKMLTKERNDRYWEIAELISDIQNHTKTNSSTKARYKNIKEQKASIGVLAFNNLSNIEEQEYFCDGVAEEIINALSRLENLHVAARTSSFFFKGKNIGIGEIGKKLNVAHVLEGSVRIAGDRLRINIQLINVEDGYHIWSERYDRKMDDIFEIQDEISLAVVDKLKVTLLSGEKSALLKRYTENVEAYNLYLKGNFYLQLLEPKGFRLAVECFQKVLKLDPSYALAYTGLGSVNTLRVFFDDVSSKETMPQAKNYAQNALQIENNLGEAHALLARVQSQYEWNWTAAEQSFKTALKLNPNYTFGNAWYAVHLGSIGRHKEAIMFAKRATELDPLSSYIKTVLVQSLNMHHQFDEAILYANESITLNPKNSFTFIQLGFAYEGKSMIDDAILAYEKAVDLSDGRLAGFYCSACFYYKIGDWARATELFENLKANSKKKYVQPMSLCYIYLARNEFDNAYDWLLRAFHEHDPLLAYYNEMPLVWARIPDDDRFIDLMKKIGMKPKSYRV